MKLYTRTGDDGSTGLFDGRRVGKDSPRIDACGEVDELNSLIGWAAAACGDDAQREILAACQRSLFEMGADIATPRPRAGEQDRVARITPHHAGQLEKYMDEVCDKLPPMDHFILPGGTELAARLHVARAVCRRVERRCVTLLRSEPVCQDIPIYLNRLSDLLFALARSANHQAGVADVPWRAR